MRGNTWMMAMALPFVAWIFAEWMQWSDYAGLFLMLGIAMLVARIADHEMFRHTIRIHAPGMNDTINSPQPYDVIELPLLEDVGKESDADKNPIGKLAVYPLGGTHWFAGIGGGSSGYVVAPRDCIEVWDGEGGGSVMVNCDLDVYREDPDHDRNELDIKMLPEEVLRSVYEHSKGKLRGGAVYFGLYPWQSPIGIKTEERNLMQRIRVIQLENKEQREQIRDLLDRLTDFSKTDRHIKETYGRYNPGSWIEKGRENERERRD